jgi:hypothetical protein
LTTTNLPGPVPGTFIPVFTNINVVRPNTSYLWTTGYCGCGRQVLQVSSDLMLGETGWSDLWTNTVPRQENVWAESPLWTTRFYRVIARP